MADQTPAPVEKTKVEFSLMQLIPNMLTIAAICAGISAIRFGAEGKFALAVFLITLASILDGMDGRAARYLGSDSKIGAELDSLADFVNFGVAPPLGGVFLGPAGFLPCGLACRFGVRNLLRDASGTVQRRFAYQNHVGRWRVFYWRAIAGGRNAGDASDLSALCVRPRCRDAGSTGVPVHRAGRLGHGQPYPDLVVQVGQLFTEQRNLFPDLLYRLYRLFGQLSLDHTCDLLLCLCGQRLVGRD